MFFFFFFFYVQLLAPLFKMCFFLNNMQIRETSNLLFKYITLVVKKKTN